MEQIMKQLNLLAILQSSNASETLDDAVNASRNLPHKSFVPIAGNSEGEKGRETSLAVSMAPVS